MVILDTSFLIDLLRGKEEVKKLWEDIERNEAKVAIATPSIMELWSGACRAKLPAKEKEKIKELGRGLEIMSFDTKSAMEAGEIEVELMQKGLLIETEDTMIAGVARSHGERVVTSNGHYTRIQGLQVLKY